MTSYNDIKAQRHAILGTIKNLESQIKELKKELDKLDAPILQALATQSDWADKMAHAKKQLEAFHKKHDPK